MKYLAIFFIFPAFILLIPTSGISQSHDYEVIRQLHIQQARVSRSYKMRRRIPPRLKKSKLFKRRSSHGNNTLCIDQALKLQDGGSPARFTNPTGYYSGSEESDWIVPRDLSKKKSTLPTRAYINRAPYKNPIRRFSY